MPLLEAMQMGCPVICAPKAAIPETAGDAVLYVHSDDPIDWAHAFLEELPHQRQSLIARGYQRAALFSAAQTRAKWMQMVLNAIPASD